MRTVALLTLATACVDRYDRGYGEPIRVADAEFHPGALPANPGRPTPAILSAATRTLVVTSGQGVGYSGLASPDAFSIAVALPDLGTGYFVVPVGEPDVTQDGLPLTFSVDLEVGPDVPFGLQTVSFVAIDGAGRGGPRYDATLCVLPDAAHGNLAACDPGVAPPSTTFSLRWDTDVDLDLVVVAPNGKVVSAKAPTTALPAGTGTLPDPEALADPHTGRITRDSNRDCAIDGIRLESLVFTESPAAGRYFLFASLNRACGQSHVYYDLSLFRREEAGDGSWPVREAHLGAGELLPIDADAGDSFGELVASVLLE